MNEPKQLTPLSELKREIKFRVFYDGKWRHFTIGQSMTEVMQAVYNHACLLGLQFYQYTGLKDQKGNEIYEGDIVTNNLSNKVVEYSAVRGGWVLMKHAMAFTDLVKYESECIYVIGNIIQNPELFKIQLT